jgi:hypothetical protein
MSQITRLLVAAVAVLALTGCGGSSTNANGATFVSRANGICAEANHKIASLPAINTIADLLKTGPQEISAANSAVAKLRALTPPSAKQGKLRQLISGLTEETALIGEVVAAVRAGNVTQAQSLAAQASARNASDHATATSLGLTECTKSAPTASSNATSTSTGTGSG